jgi:polyhydroxybutyrate depolymerase
MRLPFAFGVAAATVLTVLACSSSSNPGPAGTSGADGAGGDDGAVVDPDGNVVPADSGPAGVTVTTEILAPSGRDYLLVVPKTYVASRSYPLILVIHGDGGTGSTMRQYHPLDDTTGDAAIVVYPSGTARTWDLTTAFAQNDDQQYIEAVVAAVKGKYTVDAARVFGVGWSSGAFLVNQLACRRPGLFSAIVSHAGGAPYELPQQLDADGYQKCASGAGVSALMTHGGSDTTVQPDSGDFDAQFWAHLDGCNPDASTRVDTSPAPCQKHVSCPAGKAVTFCLIPGNNHGVWAQAISVEWAFLQAL